MGGASAPVSGWSMLRHRRYNPEFARIAWDSVYMCLIKQRWVHINCSLDSAFERWLSPHFLTILFYNSYLACNYTPQMYQECKENVN
jgi:hypothetical protein